MTDLPIKRQIFIGGCSRSGTTLLGAIIGAHSQCVATPESHFKISILKRSSWLPEKADIGDALKKIRNHWRFKIWELDLDETKLPAGEMAYSYPALLAWIAGCYAPRVGKPGASIWVDHTPENISYAMTLSRMFPQAQFIHIIRDGRAVAASIMPLDWGPNSIMASSSWWMEHTAYGLALESHLPADRIMRIRYEDLVSQPVQMAEKLCGFLNLGYEPAMAAAGGFRPPTYTVGQHQLIGTAPDPRRISGWESQLSPRQVEMFESLTRNFLEYLDYPMRYGLQARPPSWYEIARGWMKELFSNLISNRIRWLLRSYHIWLR